MNLKAFVFRNCFWIKDFLLGSPVGIHYRELKKYANNASERNKIKEQRLGDLLKYATTNCEFYREYYGCKLEDFPVVNKSILIANCHKIKVPENTNPYQPKGMKYHIQKTSGSTGTPFAIFQDYRKRMRRLAELKYFGEIVGFKSHDSLIHLRIWTKWQSKTKKQIFFENIFPFDISNMNEVNLARLVSLINERHAICLRGYASSFDLLAKYVEKHPHHFPTLKICIAGSEALFDSTRELVKKNLGCDIISQYANEENGILAQEKVGDNSGHFYLNDSGYIFEVLKFDSDEPAQYGELGRIVITDLFNYAFPVIRYENGDTCILEKDIISGEVFISKLFGRRLDMIFNTNNEPIFPMTFARILKNFDRIRQWQFIQKSKNTFCVKLCVEENFDKKYSENQINKELKTILGDDASLEFEYVDDIPVLQSGKRKSVVNLMSL